MSEKLLHEEFRKSKKSCSNVVITFAQLNSLGIQRSVLQELVKSGEVYRYARSLSFKASKQRSLLSGGNFLYEKNKPAYLKEGQV